MKATELTVRDQILQSLSILDTYIKNVFKYKFKRQPSESEVNEIFKILNDKEVFDQHINFKEFCPQPDKRVCNLKVSIPKIEQEVLTIINNL